MPTSKPIYVLNGPNLNLLGVREPHIYGTTTLDEVRALCEAKAAEGGCTVVFRQSNHEGVLLDWVQEARTEACALVINPAGLTSTSVSLHDALKALDIPAFEVHISNVHAREAFRHPSLVSLAVRGVIAGFGVMGYELAVTAAARLASADAGSVAAKT